MTSFKAVFDAISPGPKKVFAQTNSPGFVKGVSLIKVDQRFGRDD